jgi:hypothetical protein
MTETRAAALRPLRHDGFAVAVPLPRFAGQERGAATYLLLPRTAGEVDRRSGRKSGATRRRGRFQRPGS